jgi:hypothetical protein
MDKFGAMTIGLMLPAKGAPGVENTGARNAGQFDPS